MNTDMLPKIQTKQPVRLSSSDDLSVDDNSDNFKDI